MRNETTSGSGLLLAYHHSLQWNDPLRPNPNHISNHHAYQRAHTHTSTTTPPPTRFSPSWSGPPLWSGAPTTWTRIPPICRHTWWAWKSPATHRQKRARDFGTVPARTTPCAALQPQLFKLRLFKHLEYLNTSIIQIQTPWIFDHLN